MNLLRSCRSWCMSCMCVLSWYGTQVQGTFMIFWVRSTKLNKYTLVPPSTVVLHALIFQVVHDRITCYATCYIPVSNHSHALHSASARRSARPFSASPGFLMKPTPTKTWKLENEKPWSKVSSATLTQPKTNAGECRQMYDGMFRCLA